MTQEWDPVASHGQSNGWDIRSRTVLVEGTTDEALFQLAARLELDKSGADLFADGLSIVAAGEGDQGGVGGVIRELITFRNLARNRLMPNGKHQYRFIGLFDNDRAGKEAIRVARFTDASILEYKDVFRIHPIMPREGTLDLKTLEKTFGRLNEKYRSLDWELEDLLPKSFIDAFHTDHPEVDRKEHSISDKIHRDFNRDGKSRLHQYIKKYAMWEDLTEVIKVLRALRFYLRLPLDL